MSRTTRHLAIVALISFLAWAAIDDTKRLAQPQDEFLQFLAEIGMAFA